ncbi:MAG TPA: hypothetical protein VKJ47_11925, partial [Candidatus Binatia bacterium]|nr:hypothetical protein [Candidatus Binatia bacterium]
MKKSEYARWQTRFGVVVLAVTVRLTAPAWADPAFLAVPTWTEVGAHGDTRNPAESVSGRPAPVEFRGQTQEEGSKEGQPQGRSLVLSNQVTCGVADLSGLRRQIYVSPQGNDITGCGATAAGACKTIQQGIENCSGSGCGVLVRYGLYPLSTPIALADGVSVYG